jgi:small-conductance mechanosensitive channel
MEFLTQLIPQLSTGPMLRVVGALLILGFGHLIVKVTKKGITYYKKRNHGPVDIKDGDTTLLEGILHIAIIIVALAYLNVELSSRLEQIIAEQLPTLLSVILVGVLGLIAIRISEKYLKDFFQKLEVKGSLKELGMSTTLFKIFSVTTKFFLYLVLANAMLYILEIDIQLINQLLNAFSWAFAFLTASITFYMVKDLFHNLGAGFYLQKSRILRPGEEVKIEGETGEIKEVSLFGTKIETKNGYTVLKPNRKILDSGIRFKEAKTDLDMLEEIRTYFSTSNPEEASQASLKIAEEILNIENQDNRENFEQGDIAQAAEELSNKEMKAAWIEKEKISSIEGEYKTWFNDGALILTRFNKKELFPDSEPGKYALSIGAEGEDILNLDPVETSSGGVYYVNSEKIKKMMDKKDGYLVIAPKDTKAYWRIKKDLIYAEKETYEQLSKTLESKLMKIMRRGKLREDVSPEQLRHYLKKWRKQEPEAEGWTPEGGEKNENSGNN